MERIRKWLCQLLCKKWCDIQIGEAWIKAWGIGYDIGYEDGKAGREPSKPVFAAGQERR